MIDNSLAFLRRAAKEADLAKELIVSERKVFCLSEAAMDKAVAVLSGAPNCRYETVPDLDVDRFLWVRARENTNPGQLAYIHPLFREYGKQARNRTLFQLVTCVIPERMLRGHMAPVLTEQMIIDMEVLYKHFAKSVDMLEWRMAVATYKSGLDVDEPSLDSFELLVKSRDSTDFVIHAQEREGDPSLGIEPYGVMTLRAMLYRSFLERCRIAIAYILAPRLLRAILGVKRRKKRD